MSTHYAQVSSEGTTHYRLTPGEWLQAVRQLLPSQRDILYYLRALNPWGDRELDFSVRSLADDLGCSPSTISRGLHALHEKGWIDLEVISAQCRVRTRSHGSAVAETDRVALSDQVLRPGNGCCVEGSGVAPRDHLLHPCNSQPPEPLPGMDSEIAQTIQTKQTDQTQQTAVCVSESFSSTSEPSDQEETAEVSPEILVEFPSQKLEGLREQSNQSSKQNFPPPKHDLLQVERLGVNPNDLQLQKVMAKHPQNVEPAIAAVAEYSGQIKRPTRFFIKAILEGWQPEVKRKKERLPNLEHVEASCDVAFRSGNLAFVVERLQWLLSQGWEEIVTRIICSNDWGLKLIDGDNGLHIQQEA